MVTGLVTLQGILEQRLTGHFDLAEFAEAIWEFAKDTDDLMLLDVMEKFDGMAENDIDGAEEMLESFVRMWIAMNGPREARPRMRGDQFSNVYSRQQLTALPTPTLADFEPGMTYQYLVPAVEVNLGTDAAPDWQMLYYLKNHTTDTAKTSYEFAEFKRRLKQGIVYVDIIKITYWHLTVTTTTPNFVATLTMANPLNLVINWGDGGLSDRYTSGTAATHTYAVPGTYTIAIVGTFNAGGTIKATPLGNTLKATTAINSTHADFSSTFENCTGLTSIPPDIFMQCVKANTFSRCFAGCTGLSGVLPAIFTNQSSVTTFADVFAGCTNITGIAANFFGLGSPVVAFDRAFSGCTKFTSVGAYSFGSTDQFTFVDVFKNTVLQTIDNTAFVNATQGKSYGSAFEGITTLTAVPAGLFQYNTACTSYDRCFYGCTALTNCGANAFGSSVNCSFVNLFVNTRLATIDATAFDNAAKATSFASAFAGLTTLTAVPSLFTKMTACTNFSNTFKGCTGIITIPDTLFKNCSAAINYTSCFDGCINITAAIGTSFFNLTAPSTIFARCFYNCQNLSGTTAALWTTYPGADGTNCFFNCFSVTNRTSIPLNWGGRPAFTYNTATLTDVPFMYADLKANTKYFVAGIVRINRNSGSSSSRVAFTFPSGAAMYISVYGTATAAGNANLDILTQSGVQTSDTYLDGGTLMIFQGSIITGATAGKLQLQMMVTATPTSISIQPDSRIDVVEDINMPVLAADFLTTSTTYINVPGQSVVLQPFKTYRFSLVYTLNPNGGNPAISVTVPANATISAGWSRNSVVVASSPNIGWVANPMAVGTSGSSNYEHILTGIIRTGDTGGNAQVQFRSNTGVSVTLFAGALLSIMEAPNGAVVTTDFTTTSGVLVDVPALTFPVQAGKLYRVFGGIGYNTSSALTLAFKTPSAIPKEMSILAKVERARSNQVAIGTYRIAAPSPSELTGFSNSGTGLDASVSIIMGYFRAAQSGTIVFQTRNADNTGTTVTVRAGSGLEVMEVQE